MAPTTIIPSRFNEKPFIKCGDKLRVELPEMGKCHFCIAQPEQDCTTATGQLVRHSGDGDRYWPVEITMRDETAMRLALQLPGPFGIRLLGIDDIAE